MTGKVHAVAGVVFGVAGACALVQMPEARALFDNGLKDVVYENITVGDVANVGILVASSWLGSLLPDIDHPTSTMSKQFWFVSFPYRILQFIFGKFKATKDFVGHRGITHSILFMLIPIVIMAFVHNPWVWISMTGLTIGMFSHLIMDMLNPMGVPLLLPFVRKKFRLLPKKLCYKMNK